MQFSFIFDMDGLILDTEKIARKVWPLVYDFISEQEADDDYLHIVGRSNPAIIAYLSAKYPDQPIEKFNNRIDEEIVKYVSIHGAGIKDGVLPLLDFLDRNHIKKAIATSSQRNVATALLSREGLLHRFDIIVCGNEVMHSKPAPDIFLEAAAKLNTIPSNCYVCEDSYNGIIAAFNGKMIPIMVPDQVPPNDEMRQKAFRIYSKLSDIIPYLIKQYNLHE
ncbi:MAG: HAD family phosphatase [Lachnospiraceae bacterium]|nr:HAD family phosphatase [Lachnospiraceae bacterium]MBO5485187.1 HAD family phosphatase [Lachnospiraceae bacterium]